MSKTCNYCFTGVNQGDHYQFFDTFANEIRDSNSVAVIQGRNCLSLKSAINTMVFGLIGQHLAENVCYFDSAWNRPFNNENFVSGWRGTSVWL